MQHHLPEGLNPKVKGQLDEACGGPKQQPVIHPQSVPPAAARSKQASLPRQPAHPPAQPKSKVSFATQLHACANPAVGSSPLPEPVLACHRKYLMTQLSVIDGPACVRVVLQEGVLGSQICDSSPA